DRAGDRACGSDRGAGGRACVGRAAPRRHSGAVGRCRPHALYRGCLRAGQSRACVRRTRPASPSTARGGTGVVELVYLGWGRQKVGVSEEQVDVPREATTVGAVAKWLHARGGGYADAFADLKRLRAAVNQEHVDFAAPVRAGDEIAFFPPVTGG